MQSASSRIWTRVTVFISYGDNNYTTGTSITPLQIISITSRVLPPQFCRLDDLLFPSLLVPLPILWRLLSPSPLCSIGLFWVLQQGPDIYFPFSFTVFSWDGKIYYSTGFFGGRGSWMSLSLVVWPWSFISQNPRSLYVSFSWADSKLYIYHLFV